MSSLLQIGLSNALTAGLLALILLPLARLLGRAALTHAICVLILLKLLTPPILNVPVSIPSFDADAAQSRAPQTIVIAEPTDPVAEEEAEPAQAIAPAEHGSVEDAPQPPRSSFHFWPAVIVVPWLAGSALCLILIGRRVRSLRRVIRLGTAAPLEVQRQAEELACRLGLRRVPPITFIPGTAPPMMLALFARPRLLIPSRFWDRLDLRQRQTLLLHELVHLKRRDHWVRYLELLVTVLYWWNPLAWWARRELREAEEQCCDAWVVSSIPGSARTYMSTLVEAVEFLCDRRHPAAATPMLASGMGQFHCLERRLRMVKLHAINKSLSRGGRAAVLALAAVLPFAPSAARSEQPVQEIVTVEKSAQDVPGDNQHLKVYQLRHADAAAAGDQLIDLGIDASAESRTNSLVVKSLDGDVKAVDGLIQSLDIADDPTADKGDEPKADKADSKEIQKLRDRVKRLSQELNDAQQRLAALEGRDGKVLRFNNLFDRSNPKGNYLELRAGSGRVDAFDSQSGKQLWQFKLDKAEGEPSASVNGRRVVVATPDGKTYYLEARTGKVLSERDPRGRNRNLDAPAAKSSDDDRDRRLRAVEEKLDRLLRQMDKQHDKNNPAAKEGADSPGKE